MNSLWSQAEHAISAIAAEPEEARLLAVEAGVPCLLVERRTWNQNASITAVRLLYPGSRHRFVGRFGPTVGSETAAAKKPIGTDQGTGHKKGPPRKAGLLAMNAAVDQQA
jgi:hypothetical protein